MTTNRPSVRLLGAIFRLCLAAFSTVGACVAQAQDKALPIGATQWPPFEFSDARGKAVGTDTEIIEQVLKRLGYTPQMILQPWNRVETTAARGDFAAIYSVIRTPEREQLFFYSDAINSSASVFFKRKADSVSWKSFDDLKNQRIAIAGGYAYPIVFGNAVKRKTFASVKETFDANADLSNLRALKAGLVDLVLCEVNVCSYLIKQYRNELDALHAIPTVVGDAMDLHVAFPKAWPGSEQLVRQFNAELAKFIADGSRAKIFKAYGIGTTGK